jgi:hypothetical protein
MIRFHPNMVGVLRREQRPALDVGSIRELQCGIDGLLKIRVRCSTDQFLTVDEERGGRIYSAIPTGSEFCIHSGIVAPFIQTTRELISIEIQGLRESD